MSISLLRLFSRAHYWVNKYILKMRVSSKELFSFLKNSSFPLRLFLICFVRGRANANPHYQKFCARVSHVWGNRRPQPQRSAMPGPHPEGAALLITASPAPGKYEVHWPSTPTFIPNHQGCTCGSKSFAESLDQHFFCVCLAQHFLNLLKPARERKILFQKFFRSQCTCLPWAKTIFLHSHTYTAVLHVVRLVFVDFFLFLCWLIFFFFAILHTYDL